MLIRMRFLQPVTVMMGKSVIEEDHPQFIGLYEGNRSRAYVKNRVEESDCILYLGALMTDFNTGGRFPQDLIALWILLKPSPDLVSSGFSADLKAKRLITATHDKVSIKYHSFDNIPLSVFMEKLKERVPKKDKASLNIKPAIQG